MLAAVILNAAIAMYEDWHETWRKSSERPDPRQIALELLRHQAVKITHCDLRGALCRGVTRLCPGNGRFPYSTEPWPSPVPAAGRIDAYLADRVAALHSRR